MGFSRSREALGPARVLTQTRLVENHTHPEFHLKKIHSQVENNCRTNFFEDADTMQ
jgi:hypothetical protein